MSRLVVTSVAVALVVLIAELQMGAGALMRAHLVHAGELAAATTVFSMATFGIVGVLQPVRGHAEDWEALTAIGGIVNAPTGMEPALGHALDVILLVAQAKAAEIELAPREATDGALTVSRGEVPQQAGTRRPPSLALPLEFAGSTVGVLRLWAAGRQGLDSSPRFLDVLAAHMAVAIHSRNLRDEARWRQEDAELLHGSALRLAALHDRREVLEAVVAEAESIFQAAAAAICLGEASGLITSRPTPSRPGCPGLSRGVPSAVRNATCDGTRCTLPCLGGSLLDREHTLSAPMMCAEEVIGDLCVTQPAGGLTARNRALLKGLAEIAAAAINNCRARELEHRELVLEERARISREMHDGLAQALGYLHLKAEQTRRVMARDVSIAERELENMATVARDAYQDVREAILGLRETLQGPRGLDSALRTYAEKFTRQSGIDVAVEVVAGEVTALAPDAEIQVVRVVQEALTNVRKHARASKVTIRLDQQESGLLISVQDNGCGFDWDALQRSETQFGMKTMRERLEQIGGTLSVSSAVGEGTDVCMLLRQER